MLTVVALLLLVQLCYLSDTSYLVSKIYVMLGNSDTYNKGTLCTQSESGSWLIQRHSNNRLPPINNEPVKLVWLEYATCDPDN